MHQHRMAARPLDLPARAADASFARRIGDGGADAGNGGEACHQAAVQPDPLGQRDVLALLRPERDLEPLVTGDDHWRRGVALHRRVDLGPRLQQRAACHDERRGHGQRDERAGERARPSADAEEGDLEHHAAARFVMRSATASADADATEPARRPSAMKITLSASAAATGSWVTMTMVWPVVSTTS